MPRRPLPQPEVKPAWDVNNTEVRKILRAFEVEINKFKGPWRFEQWMVANGCINTRDPNYHMVKVKCPDGTIVLKPEYSSVNGLAFARAHEKYTALRILQKMTKTARLMSEPPPIEMNVFTEPEVIREQDLPF